ncbi:nucleoside-diphosphate-sugar epimerase [Pseudonocardia sediminis]|uniref:Nucleoside-diphosphate-sugar epimerase n=1 Tax=Pseudonocardia sediminis TaxID=1397368 RepID=A0A4Q7UUW7_PSEST|nr:NmrA family NAD(P)-binding protein [Pseudonocardia sediminis]RZT85692.1 nucleoside-diphosphate-sugar epimerase [Pseudonocardia sediminis]
MTTTLVIGGTGAMGTRVVERLFRAGRGDVVVLTRDPRSAQALELARRGGDRLRLAAGDLTCDDDVRRALRGVDRVFCNTDFFSSRSVLTEYEQGLSVLRAACDAGVDRFVYSSLDNAVALTGGAIEVPHFDSKAAVAAWIGLQRSEEMMRHEHDGWYREHVSIITTSPYFENLTLRLAPRFGDLPDGRQGYLFSLPLGRGRYPLIALDDIAWFADFMFEHWQSWGARDLAVAGDNPTGDEIAATFEAVTTVPAAYAPLPTAVVESVPDVGHDYAALARFMQHRDIVARDRDMEALRGIHPDLMNLEDWLRATGWDGTERRAQRFPIRIGPRDAP